MFAKNMFCYCAGNSGASGKTGSAAKPLFGAGGESAATRDIVAQVLMISPLCELGTLTDLLRGGTRVRLHVIRNVSALFVYVSWLCVVRSVRLTVILRTFCLYIQWTQPGDVLDGMFPLRYHD